MPCFVGWIPPYVVKESGANRVNILLTTRREANEPRNPIALLDLAAYWRSFGHTVDCYYLDQIYGYRLWEKSYDLVGLSVLQALKEDTPLKDALHLRKLFRTEVVVGGKWTRTTTEEQKAYLAIQKIKVYEGAGEYYLNDREINFEEYPSWQSADFITLGDVRPDIMSARGCPYHCHFCHNTEQKLSFFSPKRSADNIQLLFQLGEKTIFFNDDIFTLKPAHMGNLYQELERRHLDLKNRNEFFIHVHHINEETLKWIKTYEPFRVHVGIESGDDRMLQLMGKGFDHETAFQKLKILRDELQVPIGALFLIGFPGETEESLKNTLDFILRIRSLAGSWVSFYQPVRGTKGYEMALERNKRMKLGRRNTGIPYVDPNLTKKLLFKYHYQMMDFSSPHSMRRRLIYSLIDLLPYWLLAPIRQYRLNRRLI